MARYLTTGQVARLLWPRKEEETAGARLLRMTREAGPGAYLKRLWMPLEDGKREAVWGLTDLGYAVGQKRLGWQLPRRPPKRDLGVQHLRHDVELAELLVSLLALPGSGGDEMVLPKKWRWIPGSSAEVPFAEHDPRDHNPQDRLYRADAVLHVPHFSRRYVIEYETGTASLTNAKHRASTVTKLGRFYRAFIEPRRGVLEVPKNGPAPTYASRFFGEDGLYAKLVFVTRSETRRDSIREVIEKWARSWSTRERDGSFEALTFEEAKAKFVRLAALSEADVAPRAPAALQRSPQRPEVSPAAHSPASVAPDPSLDEAHRLWAREREERAQAERARESAAREAAAKRAVEEKARRNPLWVPYRIALLGEHRDPCLLSVEEGCALVTWTDEMRAHAEAHRSVARPPGDYQGHDEQTAFGIVEHIRRHVSPAPSLGMRVGGLLGLKELPAASPVRLEHAEIHMLLKWSQMAVEHLDRLNGAGIKGSPASTRAALKVVSRLLVQQRSDPSQLQRLVVWAKAAWDEGQSDSPWATRAQG